MKRVLTSAAAFCALSFSVFAYPHNGMDDQYQSNSNAAARITTPHKWQQCMIDKEGWIEGGAEWLYLTSSLSPIFTQGATLTLDTTRNNTPINVPNASFNSAGGFSSVEQGRINPEYNSGLALFFRYRGCSDNDLSLRYDYLRNNGDGSLNIFDETLISVGSTLGGSVDGTIGKTIQAKGYLRSHMHVFDLVAGRLLPLNYQMLVRLSGGLTVSDFHLLFQQNYASILEQTAGGVSTEAGIYSFFREKVRFWGLGPKAQMAFEYMMLPSQWNHSLNLNINVQYALLYSKQWSKGKVSVSSVVNSGSQSGLTTENTYRFRAQPDHHLIQNVNLDVGLNYRWESSYANMIFNLGAGYRVYSYWNLYELFTNSFVLNATSTSSIASLITRDETMIYGGPYIRFSLAY